MEMIAIPLTSLLFRFDLRVLHPGCLPRRAAPDNPSTRVCTDSACAGLRPRCRPCGACDPWQDQREYPNTPRSSIPRCVGSIKHDGMSFARRLQATGSYRGAQLTRLSLWRDKAALSRSMARVCSCETRDSETDRTWPISFNVRSS